MALASAVSRSLRTLLCAARSTVRPQPWRMCSASTTTTTTTATTASTTCSTVDGCEGSLDQQKEASPAEATGADAVPSQPEMASTLNSAETPAASDTCCSTDATSNCQVDVLPAAEEQLSGTTTAAIEEPPPILADVPSEQPPAPVDAPKPATAKPAAKKADAGGMRVNLPPNRMKNPAAMSKSTLADAVAALKRQNGSDMRIIEMDGLPQPAKEKS